MKNNTVITPIILFILGLVLLIVPGGIINTVIRVMGIIIIISSAATIKGNLNSKEISYSILLAILGLVFIFEPSVIAGIIPFILGAYIILKSIIKLQMIRAFNSSKDYLKPFIINIVTLLLGIVLIFNPFRGAETIIRIIAIFILAYSLLDIIDYFLMKPKRVKVIK